MRTYKRAKGPYYLLDAMKDKLSETAYKTKKAAREAAKIMMAHTDLQWIGIEQVEYERVPIHEGAPCPKCWQNSHLVSAEASLEYPDGPHLHCPKCGSNYDVE